MESIPSTEKSDVSKREINSVPLAVDLDGTLVKTDLLVESLLVLVKRNPLYVFLILIWVLKGKAYFKHQVGRRVTLDVSSLPYHLELLIHLRNLHEQGRRLILATAADERIAGQIVNYLQLFDTMLASDGITNLSGIRKRDRLLDEFGEKGFDYAGNSPDDLVVWAAARNAIVVSSCAQFRKAADRIAVVAQFFEQRQGGIKQYLGAVRLHQWLKNSLIFVPLLAAHRIHDAALFAPACLAFVAFGLCASSVYVLNDLLDLSEDRRHPRKRYRPFAAGELSLLSGLVLAPTLLVFSILLSLLLPGAFLGILAAYYSLTLAYSFYIKYIMMLDVIVLAALFTVRMMAGSAAVNIWPSHWLLAFSMFLFVSLALVKRYAELVIVRKERGENASARGYVVGDRELLAAMGSASGFISVLVLALYIASGAALQYYGHHRVIWLACPLLFFWISYIWLLAHRGTMHDDPLVFALRDPGSWIIFLLMTAVMIVAT